MAKSLQIYLQFIRLISFFRPVMMLTVRMWIATIFFSAGKVKISDFNNTIALFREEYKTPFLSPVLAAGCATAFELGCSVLLMLGLFSRLATLPLIVMTAVITFTYDDNIQHYYWAMLLGLIFFYGADKISLDYFIQKHWERHHGEPKKIS